MARKPEAEQGDASQSRRFIETARALGCDEDEAAFREKLRVIARQKPKDEPKPAKAAPKKPR
jgi:hypothetical protein